MKKVFHYINFVLIFLFLVAICVIEDHLVTTSLASAQNSVFAIEQSLEQLPMQDSKVVMQLENLEYNWTRDEERLCYLVNHKNVQELGMEIEKMKTYVLTGDEDAFRVSLGQIKFFCHTYTHFMGANINNLL